MSTHLHIDIYTKSEQLVRCNDWFLNREHSFFYQSLAYFKMLVNVPGYKPLMIVASSNNKIVGSLMGVSISEHFTFFSGITSRFLLFFPPLIDSNDTEALSVLNSMMLVLLRKTKRSNVYHEIRNASLVDGYKKLLAMHGFEYQDHLNQLVSLEDEKDLWAGLNAGKRKQVQRSYSAGMKVEDLRSEVDLAKFYKLLSNHYQYKVKKPLPPYEYFQSFATLAADNQNGFLLIAKYKDEVIGGIVCPTDSDRAYELYITGADKSANAHQLYPSVCLTWEAMKRSTELGLTYFDFMGTGKPNVPYGVRRFKKQFGGEEIKPGRFTRINKPVVYYLASRLFPLYQYLRLLK